MSSSAEMAIHVARSSDPLGCWKKRSDRIPFVQSEFSYATYSLTKTLRERDNYESITSYKYERELLVQYSYYS